MAIEQFLHRSWLHGLDHLDQLSWGQLILALVIIWSISSWMSGLDGPKVPMVGYRWPFEPKFLVRMRFVTQGLGMMSEGYSKFKDSIFKITTHDADWLIIPKRYLDDLQSLPVERLSVTDALVTMWGSDHGPFALLKKSDLGTRALRDVVVPNYARDLDGLADELRYTLEHDITLEQDWTTVDTLQLCSKMILRISQRILVGWPMSRDQELIDCTQAYTNAVTIVQFGLKPLPRLLRPIVYPLIPAGWTAKACVRQANKLLAKEMQRREHLEKTDPTYEKPKDLLQGMVDLDPSRPLNELGSDFLVQVQISRTAPVVTMARALMDLALHPQDLDELRNEIEQVMGRNGEGLRNLRQTLNKLEKMDSFLRESARWTPLSMVTVHRVVQDAAGITLHDGVHLPRGTHLAFPAYNIGRDPAMVPDAHIFNGMRWYQQRLSKSFDSDRAKCQFATPDSNYLTFGSGKYVCPGRFIASHMMKLMMVAVLLRYDFKWIPGTAKPSQKYVHVFAFPDKTTLLMKQRPGGEHAF
uniref:Cytochrome P450 monooxygenase spdJ n=1 Tax=Cordana terrestris TaxID=1293529 RepID=SPDJ_CORTS|nr:putative cytochrome P450 [Cordana terrestris]